DENETMEIACENVILSVGQATVWGDLLKDENVEFRGPAPAADKVTFQTTVPDIFVVGDMFYGPRFAIDAIACGREGAESIHRFVQPHSSLTIGRDPNFFIELDKDDISVKDYDHVGRQTAGIKASADGKLSFRDNKLVFTEEQVKKETSRCLSCGASIVDPNKCVGCGLCTTRCEFDAIKLTRDNPDCSTMRKAEDKLKYILPNGAKQALARPFVKKTPKETAWLKK
ncbi:MAG: 4Fe-4S binding protein, partial [Butyrivibrio sp.]|nr:4Fe-4S binding protein [Butyrivibrio sp.]